MSNVLDLSTETHARIEARWESYLVAKKRADETMEVDDGIAAARAWRRWLDLFMSDDQRRMLDRAGEIAVIRRRFG